MAKDLNKALEAVEMTYGQIKQIADDMLAAPFEEVNRLYGDVSTLSENEVEEFIVSNGNASIQR